MLTRREMIAASGAALASSAVAFGTGTPAWAALPREPAEGNQHARNDQEKPQPPGEPNRDYTPVITPNGTTLPFKPAFPG